MPDNESNPYQSTAIHGTNLAAQEGFWRDGDKLVVRRRRHNLPDRCVLCNEAAEGRRYSLNLVHGYKTFVMQNASAIVRIGLCRRHFRGKRFALYLRWVAVLRPRVAIAIVLGLTALITRFQHMPEPLIWITSMSGAYMVAWIYVTNADSVPLSAALIDRGFVWIDGVSPVYLAEVPDIPQSEPTEAEDDPSPNQAIRSRSRPCRIRAGRSRRAALRRWAESGLN